LKIRSDKIPFFQKRYPSQRPKKRRRPQKAGGLLQKKLTSSTDGSDFDDEEEVCSIDATPSHHGLQDDSPLGHHMISGSPLKEGRGENDVSLASVAKDLLMEGFDDDPELSDMLGLAVDEFSSIMGHDELKSIEHSAAGMFTSPPSCPPGIYGAMDAASTSTGGYALDDGVPVSQHDATHRCGVVASAMTCLQLGRRGRVPQVGGLSERSRHHAAELR